MCLALMMANMSIIGYPHIFVCGWGRSVVLVPAFRDQYHALTRHPRPEQYPAYTVQVTGGVHTILSYGSRTC